MTPAKSLLPVSLTPGINLCHGFSVITGVIDTGEQFITGDNDTGNNFVAGDNDTGDNFVAGHNGTGEQLSPVTTTPAINLLPITRTRTPWRWGAAKERTKLKGINRRYLRPPQSATAADGVIGTAMKSCIQRHPTHLDQRPLRPPKGAFVRFHGCSNDNIGGRGRLRRPEIVFSPVSLIPVRNNQIAKNLSPVSTIPLKNCLPVSTTPLINFSPVSATLAIRESCQY